MLGLARGLGAQIAGKREKRARSAEQAQPAITQEQRDAARQAGTWGRVEDTGRKAREADRTRQGLNHQRPGERQGPRMDYGDDLNQNLKQALTPILFTLRFGWRR